ncbi:MAG TPA: molybdopterin molybdenumtransferase MoeA, partial [Stellaceae bacterium]|nr:molybdopterin molybdenumtransferase MoeA [Stellaceae bacterium]
FAIIGRPLISRLAGGAAERPTLFRVRAEFAYKKRPGRREYVRTNLRRHGDVVTAHKYPKDGAGILSSIVGSDGFVIVDDAADGVQPGTMVDFLPFAEIIG